MIVNVFFDLARTNLLPTFRMLETIASLDHPPSELDLALAAVGGLFCDVQGSYSVAKAMFNDSRKLLLASVSLNQRMSFLDCAKILSSVSRLFQIFSMWRSQARP